MSLWDWPCFTLPSNKESDVFSCYWERPGFELMPAGPLVLTTVTSTWMSLSDKMGTLCAQLGFVADIKWFDGFDLAGLDTDKVTGFSDFASFGRFLEEPKRNRSLLGQFLKLAHKHWLLCWKENAKLRYLYKLKVTLSWAVPTLWKPKLPPIMSL